jgi:hypothetical protein
MKTPLFRISTAWHSIKEYAACRLTSRRLESHASIWTRAHHVNVPHIAGTSCAPSRLKRLDGRDLLAPCALLPPYRWTSRGGMRGVGATCAAPTTSIWTSQAHISPGILPDRLAVTTATLASQQVLARGFATRSTGLAGRVRHYSSKFEIRATRRVFRRPGRPRYSARGAKVGFIRGGEF